AKVGGEPPRTGAHRGALVAQQGQELLRGDLECAMERQRLPRDDRDRRSRGTEQRLECRKQWLRWAVRERLADACEPLPLRRHERIVHTPKSARRSEMQEGIRRRERWQLVVARERPGHELAKLF